jgi:malonate transporter
MRFSRCSKGRWQTLHPIDVLYHGDFYHSSYFVVLVMAVMSDIFSTIAAVLLVVFVGQILWRRQFVPVFFWDGLSKICYWILFPCLLFDLVSTLQFDAPFLLPFAVTILVGSAAAVIFGLLSGWLLNASGPTTSSLVQGGLRYNAFLMLAFVQGAFGLGALEVGVLSVAILVPIANIGSVLVIFLMRDSDDEVDLVRAIFTELARNPLIGAIILGGLVNFLGILVPSFMKETAELLGKASLPMLLLCVGASIRVAGLKSHKMALLLAVLSKLLILPSVVMITGIFLGLEKEVLLVLVVLATAPTAASSYTLAHQLGGDAPIMAEIITVQTLVSAFAIPGWVLVISALL